MTGRKMINEPDSSERRNEHLFFLCDNPGEEAIAGFLRSLLQKKQASHKPGKCAAPITLKYTEYNGSIKASLLISHPENYKIDKTGFELARSLSQEFKTCVVFKLPEKYNGKEYGFISTDGYLYTVNLKHQDAHNILIENSFTALPDAELKRQELKKFSSTINSFSIHRIKDINATFAVMYNQPGFYILAVEGNHPARPFGITHRGREVSWKEYFKYCNNRNALGNHKQAAAFIGDCFWCWSQTGKKIKKLLLTTRSGGIGVFPIPTIVNDKGDIKWAKEKIAFIWKEAFPSLPVPKIQIIPEAKYHPYPMEEQCRAALGENEFEKALALLHKKSVKDKMRALIMLEKIKDEECIEIIFKTLHREVDWKVINRAISTSFDLNLHKKFYEKLTTLLKAYEANTDHYDEADERERWKQVLEILKKRPKEFKHKGST